MLPATLRSRLRAPRAAALLPPWPRVVAAGSTAAGAPSLLAVFATFLKLGAVAFGSGYVLLVFLRSELVLNLHWLSDRQVVDAIAISRATPGPVFPLAAPGLVVAGAVAGAFLA